MKRLEYDKYGGPELVHLSQMTLRLPGDNELMIKVAAASINPVDWHTRNGGFRIFTGFKFPRGIGLDFSGTVQAVGKNVTRFVPGDEVVGTTTQKAAGAFATHLIANENLVVKKPAHISFEEAAALPIAGVTAWLALVKNGRLSRGRQVFINGAMGGVGLAAVSISNSLGATVTGRVGPKSIEQAAAAGIDQALDYAKSIPKYLHGTFDIVFDTNGSLTPQQEGKLINAYGKIYDINPTLPKLLWSLFSRSRKLIFGNLKAENLQPVIDLAADGKLVIPIAKTCSLEEIPALMAELEGGKRLNGKVVMVIKD